MKGEKRVRMWKNAEILLLLGAQVSLSTECYYVYTSVLHKFSDCVCFLSRNLCAVDYSLPYQNQTQKKYRHSTVDECIYIIIKGASIGASQER